MERCPVLRMGTIRGPEVMTFSSCCSLGTCVCTRGDSACTPAPAAGRAGTERGQSRTRNRTDTRRNYQDSTYKGFLTSPTENHVINNIPEKVLATGNEVLNQALISS